MQRPSSLTLRLTLLFGITAAIIFLIFGWFISHAIESHFAEGDIAELEIIARTVEEGLSGVRTEEEFSNLELRFSDILTSHHRASLYILGKDGQLIYASPETDLSAVVQTFDAGGANGSVHRWDDAKHAYRVLIRQIGGDHTTARIPYTMAIAVEIDFHLAFLRKFSRTLWLMITGGVVIMTLMGWLAVRQGHAPLRDMVARIRRISADELDTRLHPDAVPRELTDLAVSFNEMLQRVDKAFHRLSAFNADIAHELRTPVANLMTQTQVALAKERTLDEYREILYSNMEELERMAQMVGDMLFLAQADNRPRAKNVCDLDLASEVQKLFEYYEGWAEESGIQLELEGTATVMADRLMMQRALGNLLSNAIRHTASGESVRVLLSSTEERDVSIVIENPGPDIAPEHLPKLFDRFFRIDPSRQRSTNGAGLGLAIVKSIVDAHDGKIAVTSEGGITRFHITLPGHRDV